MAQKQELTLSYIKKELRHGEKAHAFSLIYVAVAIYFLCGMLVLAAHFLVEYYSWHRAAFAILAVIILLVPTLIFVRSFAKISKKIKMIDRDEIIVVEDELVRIAINEFKAKYPSRDNTVNAYYFATYDRVEVWNNSELIYTSAGDKFYLVMYNDGKNKIELTFNCKIYKYTK